MSAAFVDVDRDGWLDLFVGNCLSYSLDTHVPCVHPSGRRETYCAPETYRAQPSRFYRNRGDGTFLDATAAAGMAREFGPALGVATADADGDGWIDIFVANDQQENQLWMNQRDGTFRNLALLAGVALGGEGTAKADISVDFGDFDNDGDEDLFVTELTGQGARSTSMTAPDCSRTGARRQGSACPACRIPGSGRPGSTPTTTAGSTSSPSTAGSCTTATRRPTIPFRWISGTSFCGISATVGSRTSPAGPAPCARRRASTRSSQLSLRSKGASNAARATRPPFSSSSTFRANGTTRPNGGNA